MKPSGIRQADLSEREQIALLWQACFGERREAVDYFLEHVFTPENCLVHVEANCVVAMLHMLPAYLVSEAGLSQAHYIYAAATDPAHRSRGLMGRLLEHAFSYGESRGDVCSFLLPSENSLYQYYARHGYLPYFKTRFTEIDTADLDSSTTQENSFTALTGHGLTQPESTRELREAQLAGEIGSILWPAVHIDYAAQVNSIYGGQTSSMWDSEGRLTGYALHSAAADHCVEVSELLATEQSWTAMLKYIARLTGASRLRVRLPEHSPVLPGTGEIETFGMARSLGDFVLPRSLSGRSSYLGLTLD